MPRRHAARARGFTTWELVVALALACTLALVAVPAFGRLRADLGAGAAVEQLVASLQLARGTAAARGSPASLCPSRDGERCSAADAAAGPAPGWIVFAGAGAEDATGATLRTVRLPAGFRVFTTRPVVAYWPDARSGTTATLVVCLQGDARSARGVVVSQVGRPRTAGASPAQGAACAA